MLNWEGNNTQFISAHIAANASKALICCQMNKIIVCVGG